MADEDMERPVTRRELKEELEKLEKRLEENLDEKLEVKLEEKLEKKLEEKLEEKLAPIHAVLLRLVAHAEQTNRRFDELEHRITVESKSAIEWGVAQVRAITDAYQDLPRRVTRLEAKVFPPRRTRRK